MNFFGAANGAVYYTRLAPPSNMAEWDAFAVMAKEVSEKHNAQLEAKKNVINISEDESVGDGSADESAGGPVKRSFTREEELSFEELEEKYFPSVEGRPPTKHCLTCGGSHGTSFCTEIPCHLCGDQQHASLCCPDNQHCDKCQEKGHFQSECTAKLIARRGDLPCNLCDAVHPESSCQLLWRTFDPKPEEIRTVRSIAIYCYSCGDEGHFGP